MSQIAIFGATSSIAQACARLWAKERQHEFLLCGRDQAKLEIVARDLSARGAKSAKVITGDLSELSQLPSLILSCQNQLSGKIDIVLLAHGTLPDQNKCELSSQTSLDAISVNFLSPVILLTELANVLQAQDISALTGLRGTLAVISSVAGDRGRQSNYVYGAAKGGLTRFLQGLRNRLFHRQVHVLTINPGFVATAMTAHLNQGPLFVSADVVAKDIVKAIQTKRDVLYTPWFWRWIMLIICHIPERIFKRLKL